MDRTRGCIALSSQRSLFKRFGWPKTRDGGREGPRVRLAQAFGRVIGQGTSETVACRFPLSCRTTYELAIRETNPVFPGEVPATQHCSTTHDTPVTSTPLELPSIRTSE